MYALLNWYCISFEVRKTLRIHEQSFQDKFSKFQKFQIQNNNKIDVYQTKDGEKKKRFIQKLTYDQGGSLLSIRISMVNSFLDVQMNRPRNVRTPWHPTRGPKDMYAFKNVKWWVSKLVSFIFSVSSSSTKYIRELWLTAISPSQMLQIVAFTCLWGYLNFCLATISSVCLTQVLSAHLHTFYLSWRTKASLFHHAHSTSLTRNA